MENFLIERKCSQQRARQLLQLSDKIAQISRTASTELLEKYKAVSESIDRLIIEETKYQEGTIGGVRNVQSALVHQEICFLPSERISEMVIARS